MSKYSNVLRVLDLLITSLINTLEIIQGEIK